MLKMSSLVVVGGLHPPLKKYVLIAGLSRILSSLTSLGRFEENLNTLQYLNVRIKYEAQSDDLQQFLSIR
jgi:hypothetical protein